MNTSSHHPYLCLADSAESFQLLWKRKPRASIFLLPQSLQLQAGWAGQRRGGVEADLGREVDNGSG